MHNAAFAAAGIDSVYLPLPAVDVDDLAVFAAAFGLRGASVTIPYKIAVCSRVTRTSELAARIGAINAIRVDDGQWSGDNTDARGFLEPFGDARSLVGARASLLGAGGAARGVAIALATSGAQVCVHARNPQQAADVAALVAGAVGPWPPQPGSWDLLVNCTPIGMHPHVNDTPMPAGLLTTGTVYDLVYNPQRTRLLEEAERAGCRTLGGLEMLVGQARQAFEWWTNVRPSAAVMRDAAIDKLTQFAGGGTDQPVVKGGAAAAITPLRQAPG
jgi:shikimate dehydrogenase